MTRYQIFYRLNYPVFPLIVHRLNNDSLHYLGKNLWNHQRSSKNKHDSFYIYKYKKEKSFPTQRFKSSKSILDQSITRRIRIEIEEQTNHLRARCRAADVADAERGCVPPFRR